MMKIAIFFVEIGVVFPLVFFTNRSLLEYLRYKPMPVSIKSVLNMLIKKNAIPEISIVSSMWIKVVGKQVAEQTKPIAIRDSILLVHVSSSVWTQELSMHKKNLINRLNNLKQKNPVSDIKFRIGKTYRKIK